jgi:hypothetical protein
LALLQLSPESCTIPLATRSKTPLPSISPTDEFTFHRAAAFRPNRGFVFSSWVFVFISRY